MIVEDALPMALGEVVIAYQGQPVKAEQLFVDKEKRRWSLGNFGQYLNLFLRGRNLSLYFGAQSSGRW